MTNLAKRTKAGVATAAASLALSYGLATPAAAQSVQQQVIDNVIQNILQSVRDQIQGRRVLPPPGMMRFSAEESAFDNRNPFAANSSGNPFQALAYAKAPAMAAAPAPVWLYGVNAIGSGDRSHTIFTDTTIATATGAVDVTKIGIFTATDALTFVATGSGSWSRQTGIALLDTTTSTVSGTLAYVNGGFSADFTPSASWTRVELAALGIAAPADSTSLSYTGNVQYKYDLLYGFWIEPTVGVTYTEAYTANFGTKIGDATDVHAGGRVGTEMKWIGFTVQPSLSGAVFKIVDQNGVGAGGPLAIPAIGMAETGLGARGAAKVNVIWTPHFSSYLEAHGSSVSGTKTVGFVSTQSYGAMGGLRYTW